MAKKETKNEPKDLVEPVPEEIQKLEQSIPKEVLEEPPSGLVKKVAKSKKTLREEKEKQARENIISSWNPKTKLGKSVKEGKLKDIDRILSEEKRMLEPEIADSLLNIETDLLAAGQAKGKFGGGKRRAWRQTQKKTQEGNVVTFSCVAVVGDKNGHVGLGFGKAKETLPAREKAIRNAKLNIIKVTRGFESPEKDKSDPHTIPFIVEGKCGSARIKLIPAPRGTGLVVGDEIKKVLRLAGIKDIYSATKGQTRTTLNFAKACMQALEKTNKMRL